MTTEEKTPTRWSERKFGRRSFITKGAAGAGIAVAAMYVAPSLLSSGPKVAYAQVTGPDGGCTPGFWKNKDVDVFWPRDVNGALIYTPTQLYNSVFGNSFGGLGTLSLLDALSMGGGCQWALGRHSVAALLNAANGITFPYTEAEVISQTSAALFEGHCDGDHIAILGLKDDFDTANNSGCLDGAFQVDPDDD